MSTPGFSAAYALAASSIAVKKATGNLVMKATFTASPESAGWRGGGVGCEPWSPGGRQSCRTPESSPAAAATDGEKTEGPTAPMASDLLGPHASRLLSSALVGLPVRDDDGCAVTRPGRRRRRRSRPRAVPWFSAVGTVSPTVRPRRRTTARSATAMTWSMLCEMRITATPSSLQPADEVEHACRLAQPERRGRLVEDHELGGERHGAGDRDRLALAARHQRDLRRRGPAG